MLYNRNKQTSLLVNTLLTMGSNGVFIISTLQSFMNPIKVFLFTYTLFGYISKINYESNLWGHIMVNITKCHFICDLRTVAIYSCTCVRIICASLLLFMILLCFPLTFTSDHVRFNMKALILKYNEKHLKPFLDEM